MKEVVIISGKGGTGKTSVAAALAFIIPQVVMADCDVDAADLHLILQPEIRTSEDFYSGVKAEINPKACIGCGECEKICRFGAISHASGTYLVDTLACEGCGYCWQICPDQAIALPEQKVGQCYLSDTRTACRLVHAKLAIGADNSGKLVAKVKKEAKQEALRTGMDYILVDGSPGIGCPVISSLSGADFVLLVTEPTLSGLSDLQRVWQLTAQFKIPAGCIINKADINPLISSQIKDFLAKQNVRHLDDLPYDEDFSRAITHGKSLVEIDEAKWKNSFANIWQSITKELA